MKTSMMGGWGEMIMEDVGDGGTEKSAHNAHSFSSSPITFSPSKVMGMNRRRRTMSTIILWGQQKNPEDYHLVGAMGLHDFFGAYGSSGALGLQDFFGHMGAIGERKTSSTKHHH